MTVAIAAVAEKEQASVRQSGQYSTAPFQRKILQFSATSNGGGGSGSGSCTPVRDGRLSAT
jgi:hypothetical protein